MNYEPILRLTLALITIFFSAQLFSAVSLIAEANKPAAGFSEHDYSGIGNPSIGPSGHVAFYGSAHSNSEQLNAVWSGLPGNLQLVIKENDSLVGFPSNVLFHRVQNNKQIIVTKSGNLAFTATLKGTATQGLIAHVDGKTRGIILAGDQAPGFPPGVTLSPFIGIGNFAFTDAGMVIQGSVQDPNRRNSLLVGLWFWNFDKLELIQPPIADCEFIGFVNPISINKSGIVAFGSGLGGDLCPIETFGIFKWQAGETEMVLSDGDAVPDMIDTEFQLATAVASPLSLNSFVINDQGEIIFSPSLRNTLNRSQKESIWVLDNTNSPKLLTLTGEFLPGNEEGSFTIFPLTSTHMLNNGLSMVMPFKQDLSSAILIGNPRSSQPYADFNEAGVSQLSPIAQIGNEPPPGFGETWFFGSLTNIFLNNANQITFSGVVADARDTRNTQTTGVWRGTEQSDLKRIAYTGMPIAINGSEMTLNHLAISAAVGSSVGGHATQFDDSGQLIFTGSASSDSGAGASGIFLITDKTEESETQEEKIFTLAEQKFASFFSPANAVNQTAEGFLFRFYSATNTYMGIRAGEVFVLGAPFGPDVLNVGTTASILELLENR